MRTRSAATTDAPGASRGGAGARAVTGVLLALIRGYQLLVSPLFAGSCRFLPSCSAYAADAVRLHGPWRGSWLAVRRLARCHPLCKAGHDPVPEPPPGMYR